MIYPHDGILWSIKMFTVRNAYKWKEQSTEIYRIIQLNMTE